jgi:hypothetical protein
MLVARTIREYELKVAAEELFQVQTDLPGCVVDTSF